MGSGYVNRLSSSCSSSFSSFFVFFVGLFPPSKDNPCPQQSAEVSTFLPGGGMGEGRGRGV